MVELNNKNVENVVAVLHYSVQFLEKSSFFTELNHKTKYAFNINNEDFVFTLQKCNCCSFTGEDSVR